MAEGPDRPETRAGQASVPAAFWTPYGVIAVSQVIVGNVSRGDSGGWLLQAIRRQVLTSRKPTVLQGLSGPGGLQNNQSGADTRSLANGQRSAPNESYRRLSARLSRPRTVDDPAMAS